MEDEEEMKEGGIPISWEQSYYGGGSVINIIKQTIDNVIIMPNNNCLKTFLHFIQYYTQSMRKRRNNFKSISVFASFFMPVSGSGSESVKILFKKVKQIK